MNTWVFGMSGTGKSTLMLHEIIEDMNGGNGVVVFDPNGELTDAALSHCPKKRIRDVLFIDPTDERPVGWNPLSAVKNKPLMASLLKDTIKDIAGYRNMPTPVMERMLYNTIAALLEYDGATLLDIKPMLTDKKFREHVLENVSDRFLARKWTYWATFPPKEWRQLISSTENKAGDFSEDPRIRTVLGRQSTFDLAMMLFDTKLIFVRLPEHELGTKAGMFGALFLAYLLAVSARRGVAPPISVYLDDVEHFDTPVLRKLLSSSARCGLSLFVANQYLDQISRELRVSLLGNCARRIMFRCGIEDSGYLHKHLPEDNTNPKLHQLGKFEAMVFEGENTNRIETFHTEPVPQGSSRRRQAVVEQSRRAYGG